MLISFLVTLTSVCGRNRWHFFAPSVFQEMSFSCLIDQKLHIRNCYVFFSLKPLSVMKNCIGPRMAAVGYVGAVAVADGGARSGRSRTDVVICNWKGLYQTCRFCRLDVEIRGGYWIFWCQDHAFIQSRLIQNNPHTFQVITLGSK